MPRTTARYVRTNGITSQSCTSGTTHSATQKADISLSDLRCNVIDEIRDVRIFLIRHTCPDGLHVRVLCESGLLQQLLRHAHDTNDAGSGYSDVSWRTMWRVENRALFATAAVRCSLTHVDDNDIKHGDIKSRIAQISDSQTSSLLGYIKSIQSFLQDAALVGVFLAGMVIKGDSLPSIVLDMDLYLCAPRLVSSPVRTLCCKALAELHTPHTPLPFRARTEASMTSPPARGSDKNVGMLLSVYITLHVLEVFPGEVVPRELFRIVLFVFAFYRLLWLQLPPLPLVLDFGPCWLVSPCTFEISLPAPFFLSFGVFVCVCGWDT